MDELLTIAERLDYLHPWRLKAACRGRGSSLFFSRKKKDKQEARRLCASCPVSHHCLLFAIANEPPERQRRYGIWASTDASERHQIARRDG